MSNNRAIRRAIAIATIILLPLAIGGVYFGTMAGRAHAAENIKAAVVNADEMVTMKTGDTETPMLGGRLVAQALTAPEPGSGIQLHWTLTDAATAERGLRDGTYYAVVTIPHDFSAKLVSALDGSENPEQATVQVKANTTASPLAGKYGERDAQLATAAVSSTITQQYLENVFTGMSDMGDQIGEATDGATKLADGSSDLKKGLDGVTKGADQLADGTGQLASGTAPLVAGTQQLASGAQQLSSGTNKLAKSADDFAKGLGKYMGFVSESAKGASAGAKKARPLPSGMEQIAQGAAGVSQMVGAVNAQVGQAQTSGVTVAGDLGSADTALTSLGTNAAAAQSSLATVRNNLAAEAASCTTVAECQTAMTAAVGGLDMHVGPAITAVQGNQTVAKDAVVHAKTDNTDTLTAVGTADYILNGSTSPTLPMNLSAASKSVAQGTAKLSDQMPALVDGLNKLAGGLKALDTQGAQLASGSKLLAAGANGLSSGANQLHAGTSMLASQSSQLTSGVDGLNAGAGQLADGLTKLSDGAGKLVEGTDKFSTELSKSTDQVPNYSDSEVKQLATVVTTPVSASVAPTEVRTDDGGGSAAIIPIALWIGALGLFLLLRAVPRGVGVSSASPGRLALAGFLPGAAIMAIATFVLLVLAPLLGAQIDNWFAVLALSLLGGLSFVAVNQAAVAMWGRVGSLVSVGFFALQFACLDGVMPLQAAPAFVRALAPILPMSELGAALNGPMLGTAVPGAGAQVVGLALWGVLGLVVTAWVVRRGQRQAAIVTSPFVAQAA